MTERSPPGGGIFVYQATALLENRIICEDSFGCVFEHKGVEGSRNHPITIQFFDSPFQVVDGVLTRTSENTGEGVARTAYLTQVLDYYPFGNARIEQTYGNTSQDIQYVGTRHDEETDLNYMSARYNDTKRGQFISQDPVFWEVGQTADGITSLYNPQLQNSYSYAGNNPIAQKDPTGRFVQYLAMLFMPSVAYSPDVGEEDYTNTGLETSIVVAGFASPSGKIGKVADTASQIAKNRIAGAAFERQVGEH